jgi:MFS family permease
LDDDATPHDASIAIPADPVALDGAAAEDEALRLREAAYEKFVWDNLPRNFAANFMHGMLGMTGFRMVLNTPTFIPVYLHLLAAGVMGMAPPPLRMLVNPDFIVGLGLSLQQVGQVVSPIVGATHIEHRKKVLPASILMGTLMRVQLLGMAVCGWFLSGAPLLAAMLVFLTLFGVFSGAQRVAFQLLLAKVIPISKRGQLQGWRNLTGSLLAALLSWVAGRYLLGAHPLSLGAKVFGIQLFHNGYSTTFMFAFILTSAGLSVLQLLLREPEPAKLRAKMKVSDRLRHLPELLRTDRGFMFFMIAQILAMASRIAAPFYILFASRTVALTGENIGLLTVAMTLGDALSNMLWGYLGDRSGFRSTFVIALLLWIGSTVLLMATHSPAAVFVAFFGLGAGQSGYMMSSQTMVLEFGLREDMAMRLAFSGTAEGLMLTLGPLLGGVIAALAGYPTLFVLSIVLEAVALAVLLFLVEEPRRRNLLV